MTGFPANGSAFRRFKAVDEALDEADALLLSDSARAPSSAGSESFSNPDDSPSLHVRSLSQSLFPPASLFTAF